jgi:Cysteine rich repeat
MKKTLFAMGIALTMSAGLSAATDPATLEKSKEVKKACKADYKKLCRKVKAGEGRIVTCLRENSAKLSPDCKTALSK